jgi:hypothetical protein
MFRFLKYTLVSLALMVIGTAAALPAYADPVVVNGNFDTFVPSNGTGGGWTSINIDAVGGYRGTSGNPGGTFILNEAGQVATDPTISQLVSGFTVGQTYTLTGDVALSSGLSGGVAGFGVDVGGVNVLELNAPAVFTSFSYTFAANATDIQIRFRGEINGTDNAYRIDNIAITQAGPSAVPEPTTMILLGTGLAAGVAAKGRRRPRSED